MLFVYQARTLEVLVASPSDTQTQRDAIRQAVHDWNTTNSRYMATVLLPVMWETHTYPSLSDGPQGVINKQIVDDADLLIATLWTRLGTPTGDAESGTVEEIERFRTTDRPVFVYLCKQPVVSIDQDTQETERGQHYVDELKRVGLLSEYVTTEELQRKVRRRLDQVPPRPPWRRCRWSRNAYAL
jgi:hypothetical protein